MAESNAHKRATEIEHSGSKERLKKAAQRLRDSGMSQKVLQVPQKDMPKAIEAMKAKDVKDTVKNISGTKRKSVL